MGRRDANDGFPGAGPAGDPMPTHVSPMLAVLAGLPARQSEYGFEYKWDGIRVVCFCDGENVRLETRNLLDVTASYPELRGLAGALEGRTAVLDGEVVALDEQGRPSFGLLQHRMGLTDERALERRAAEIPVSYMVFDLLYLDGRSATGEPYVERRRLLEALGLAGEHLQTPPSNPGEGDAMLAAARELMLEGIMAKRLESAYRPGLRSREWLKVKITRRQEFVVGGWVPIARAGERSVGALLVGYYDRPPEKTVGRGGTRRLMYAGKVGTGFTDRERERLGSMLEKRRRPESPFDGRLRERGAIFSEPELVAEVEFRGWTSEGKLRQPSYKGLRDDKPAREVTIERPLET